jgi:hypothetical protein
VAHSSCTANACHIPASGQKFLVMAKRVHSSVDFVLHYACDHLDDFTSEHRVSMDSQTDSLDMFGTLDEIC